ncbi:hypothetical protein PF002_g24578 [Phytophthora fragariae]|uniref:Uncharacterized protein n=1 Tax=Phytophthora fragariae TaxID=53985 RepID=A0A6A4CAF8_9STRA|nr:hypothetical protein PF011_g22246 [Phytophthora fragariae]KAE9189018.1 hypothetical protein PF004_g22330 [Phytophthora fragariae]KAE9191148.1 hypothetical protein PF002_g24578 [Phytophthora fragariae]KAE9283590.1 hypothetical protein PF001_g22774 [Phytophthora fragariae]
MAVARINRGIAAIDLNCERSAIIPVCLATKDEWREYLNSDEQEFRSVFMEWIEGTVYIVEFGTQEQQRFARSFEFVLARPPAFWGYMALRGSAVVPNYPELPGFQTDNSYGPRTVVGTPLPRVRFILCVAVTDDLASAEYKLYTVQRDAQDRVRPLPHLDPVPVVGPHTVVTFDSWELLGLPPGANIPPIENTQFPVPTVDVDLFEALQLARE